MPTIRAAHCWSVTLAVLLPLGCTAPSEGSGSEGTGTTEGSDSSPTSADPEPSMPSTGAGPSTTTTDPTPSTQDGADSTSDDPPPAECEVASLFDPGVHPDITIDVGGTRRSYDLFVPAGYDPTAAAPLVVNFHGLFGSPSQQAGFSQFNATANDHGMLTAYPAGIGQSFNAGACCGQASATNVDDMAFARALVQDVSAKMCVDPQRVYATGMSNGGHMAHRLACEAADLFAATASVTGVLSLAGPCTPSRPISMVQFHGTADTIVGYDGFPSVVPMMEAWASRNGCSPVSEITFDQGDVRCETWPGCEADVEVTLCTIDGGGHCWPGNPSCLFGYSTTDLHASEEIASMFDEQSLP